MQVLDTRTIQEVPINSLLEIKGVSKNHQTWKVLVYTYFYQTVVMPCPSKDHAPGSRWMKSTEYTCRRPERVPIFMTWRPE